MPQEKLYCVVQTGQAHPSLLCSSEAIPEKKFFWGALRCSVEGTLYLKQLQCSCNKMRGFWFFSGSWDEFFFYPVTIGQFLPCKYIVETAQLIFFLKKHASLTFFLHSMLNGCNVLIWCSVGENKNNVWVISRSISTLRACTSTHTTKSSTVVMCWYCPSQKINSNVYMHSYYIMKCNPH